MKKIITFFKEFKIPKKEEARKALASFSKKEFYIFFSLFLVLSVSTIAILLRINTLFTMQVPAPGGTITEGIIGIPRFINPVLAVSDADKDMTALIYSGLMKKDGAGNIIPDLAASYEVSKDNLTYTFTLKENIFFHDKEPVTADDVVYTITQIKDASIKSPKKVSWEGVTVEKIDDKTVQFVLKTPYAPFIENATVGILPSHLWKNVPVEQFSFTDFNTEAIGSGPYKISATAKSSSGVPESYELEPAKRFMSESYLKNLVIRFYSNEKELVDAIQSGAVDDINSISPESASMLAAQGYRVETSVLPRVFGLFFNQSQAPLFVDKNVVAALEMAVNKKRVIDEVLRGYGVAIDSPVPAHFLGNETSDDEASIGSVEDARALLAKNGWKAGTDGVLEKTANKKTTRLAFSISTGDTPELKRAAELLKEDFEKLGAAVELKIFDIGNLNQSIIRPRKYDALFFGQVISHESDLFAFWHSSQRNDPGLNIAMYTSARADALLESSLVTLAKEDRVAIYQKFQTEVQKDEPALFIYSPKFIYVVSDALTGLDLSNVTAPSDRLANVADWYVETENIWKIFKKAIN